MRFIIDYFMELGTLIDEKLQSITQENECLTQSESHLRLYMMKAGYRHSEIEKFIHYLRNDKTIYNSERVDLAILLGQQFLRGTIDKDELCSIRYKAPFLLFKLSDYLGIDFDKLHKSDIKPIDLINCITC